LPFAVLDGDELRSAQAATIGETLTRLPSVHTTSFGQAVGRPVIRGLEGARVKILEDRIDTLDVSITSPDHATTIDPFIAESIEVYMGPSTLVYGSGASGGVVDVHTGRIPHSVPETTSARFEVRGADNGDRSTAAGRIDTGTGKFAFHADGFYRDADDYDIPGYAESSRLRALEEEEEHEGDEHGDDHGDDHDNHEEGEEVRGTLPGSFLETYGGAIGASYIGDNGFFGLAVSRYESNYGLPGHAHDHHHESEEHEGEEHDEHEGEEHDEHEGEEHGEEEGTAELDLEQTRVDLEWGQQLGAAGLDSLNLRIGYNDYEHVEFEPNGESGTKFELEGYEGRLEVVHSEWAGITGSAGIQASSTEFSALGEEAFVQPVDTESLGAFYVGQTAWGYLAVEGGLRLEHVEHDPAIADSESFNLFSGSLGFIQPLSDSWQLTGQLDYSSRAPIAIELFADGAHLATQSYEIGDPDLEEERASNVSIGMNYQSERWLLALNAYYTEFEGFIYEQATGEELDDLPVLQRQQEDASLYGADAMARWQALSWDRGALSLNASVDTVRGKLDEGENRNLPRIPPLRWSVGASLNWAGLVAEMGYTRVEEQDDTAELELITDAYDDVHVSLVYGIELRKSQVEFFVNGKNLTDDEQRLHTSFIKDLAPQPGRTIEAGVRVML
ncbi:MAG: TonB-dependent receptor, partial [Pseudomonadales bacterium]